MTFEYLCMPALLNFQKYKVFKQGIFYSLFLLSFFLKAEEQNPEKAEFQSLIEMNLEELAQVEVTSASKKVQKLTDIPAAIFVINEEDVRRSGATNVADLLRMVPGLYVASINANSWAITARGFNDFFANKLLVLVDGRSIYNAEFSGVYWWRADIPLENIERIEVIRGTAGTIWGANAVNGVINIITKPAADTQGRVVSARLGTEARQEVFMQQGGVLDEKTHSSYRLYAEHHKTAPSAARLSDYYQKNQVGFRLDSQPNAKNSFRIQGEAYDMNSGQYAWNADEQGIGQTNSNSLLFEWQHELASDLRLNLQLYHDYDKVITSAFGFIAQNFDMELRLRQKMLQNHELHYGVGWRRQRSDFLNLDQQTLIAVHDPQLWRDFINLFLQDEWQITDNLNLTTGIKLERNSYTGWHHQPNVRILWKPTEHLALWAAASRATRTPSRIFRDTYSFLNVAQEINAVYPFPQLRKTLLSDNLESESVQAYELGVRHQFSPHFSVDLTAFLNRYHHFTVAELLGLEFTPQGLLVTNQLVNKATANSVGFEASILWKPLETWKLQTAYSFIDVDVDSLDPTNPNIDLTASYHTPHHQISLRSSVNLTSQWQWDMWLRYISDSGEPSLFTEAYTTLDMRLAWELPKNRYFDALEFSIVGQNLLDNQHYEYVDYINLLNAQIQRGVYGQIRIKF